MSLKEKNFETFLPHVQKKKRFSWCTFVQLLRQYATMKSANQFYTKHCVSKLIISIYLNVLILIISSMDHFDMEIWLQLGGPIVSESTEGSCH